MDDYRRAVAMTILGQEIVVDRADYPTPQIERNSHLYRPLGLGYANLGALLMASGLALRQRQGAERRGGADVADVRPGVSDERRDRRGDGALPALQHESRALPRGDRACTATRPTRFRRRVFRSDLLPASRASLGRGASSWAQEHGFRNAQVTVLAPTGTIAFMMDCDTTGVEPDIALVKYKKLVGGGFLKIVNKTVPMALDRLGYSQEEIDGDRRLHR